MVRRRALPLAVLLVALGGSAQAQAASDFQKIFDAYARALEAGDVEALVGLYTPNGVYVREDLPAVIGRDALRQSYKNVFATLKVNISFKVQEAEQSGDLGWARSVSTGKVQVLKTGVATAESYNQLVVFRKENGSWKIRSYLYASSK